MRFDSMKITYMQEDMPNFRRLQKRGPRNVRGGRGRVLPDGSRQGLRQRADLDAGDGTLSAAQDDRTVNSSTLALGMGLAALPAHRHCREISCGRNVMTKNCDHQDGAYSYPSFVSLRRCCHAGNLNYAPILHRITHHKSSAISTPRAWCENLVFFHVMVYGR